jgi:hypothetical protein
MYCIIVTWIRDLLLREACPDPLGVIRGGLIANVYTDYSDYGLGWLPLYIYVSSSNNINI